MGKNEYNQLVPDKHKKIYKKSFNIGYIILVIITSIYSLLIYHPEFLDYSILYLIGTFVAIIISSIIGSIIIITIITVVIGLIILPIYFILAYLRYK